MGVVIAAAALFRQKSAKVWKHLQLRSGTTIKGLRGAFILTVAFFSLATAASPQIIRPQSDRSQSITTQPLVVTAPGGNFTIATQALVVTAPGGNFTIGTQALVVTAPGGNFTIATQPLVVSAPLRRR